jgi:hypothetical protein
MDINEYEAKHMITRKIRFPIKKESLGESNDRFRNAAYTYEIHARCLKPNTQPRRLSPIIEVVSK